MYKVKISDFAKFRFISNIRFNKEGKYLCYVVHKGNVEKNKYNSNLWVYDLENERNYQLTGGNKENNFIWSEDGEHVIFPSVRNDQDKKKKEKGEEITTYYKINIHGGEAKETFKVPRNVQHLEQVSLNTYILSSKYDIASQDLMGMSKYGREDEIERRNDEKDYIVIDEIPFWANGSGYQNKLRTRLYLYYAGRGACEAITEEYVDVESYELNKKLRKIVYVSNEYKDKMEIYNNIYLYDIDTRENNKIIDSEEYSFSYANFIDDEHIICVGTNRKEFGINENNKFYIIDLKTKEIKCITPYLNTSMYNSVGSDCRYGSNSSMKIDNNYLYFITTEGYNSYLNRIDIEGNIKKITDRNGSVDGFNVFNGNIMISAMRELKLEELYKVEDCKEVQLTKFNTWVYEQRTICNCEHLLVETEDGVNIDGWIIRPVDFDENKKYPAILDIHGGPKTAYGEVFFHEMQYWASQGYVVFFCNPRGSDGKGNEFADIRGKYGEVDYKDIMKFTDVVLDRFSFIDRDRVGVTGGSYGGFMTNWIIGHTDRFKAAASQRSISNWISKFCTTDIGYFFVEDQITATPWNNPEKLWMHSPLKYAENVKTPTLFIHSEEDYRCWVAEAIQMFTALKYNEVPSRLCIFKEENHELSRSGKPKHRIRRLQEITEWFDKYLK